MEDIQGILERINREGVEKADAEAKRIIADAEQQAKTILADANAKAAAMRDSAERDSADYAQRAAETIQQAARDVVLGVKDGINALLETLLAKNVEKSLADEKTALDLVKGAITALTGDGEIICGAKLAAVLKAQLANEKNITIITDESLKTGFTIRLDNGRIEHAYTAEVISEELAKRLRPDLAKLLK